MDYKELNSLIRKFWQCETTLEEEQELRDYFSQENLPPDQEDMASLFRYFSKISGLRPANVFDPDLKPRTENTGNKRPGKSIILFTRILYKVAAVFLIGMGTAVLLYKLILAPSPGFKMAKDTYEDPRDAYRETRKVLLIVSQKLNTAEYQAGKLSIFYKTESELRNKKQ